MEGIAVLDFGGQYAHLLCNRIRRLHVYAEIFSPSTSLEDIRKTLTPKGIILSGGPSSVYESGQPPYNPDLVRNPPSPILGVCYGHQLLCKEYGGVVSKGDVPEFGSSTIMLNQSASEGAKLLLDGLKPQETMWMSHRDSVSTLPEGFEVLANTKDCPVAAFSNPHKKVYGVQFHPEVTHSEHGMLLLENFVVKVCGVAKNWTMDKFVDDTLQAIKDRVKDRKALVLVSGGVDSAVAFLLLNKALGVERVLGLYIDTGFMRRGESETVKALLHDAGLSNLHTVDASEDFLQATKGVAEPEKKRKIIGQEFINVRDKTLAALKLNVEDWLLGQGTLYTDTIESGGTKHADVIKTHHNRVDIIQDMISKGLVVEPLSQLYKDEVREVGRMLGLRDEIRNRHPFPGPGLSVRVLCSPHDEDPAALTLPQEQLIKAKQAANELGYDAELLPLKSVGVQGDSRTYAHPLVVFPAPATTSSELQWEVLEILSTKLTNNVAGVNRVVSLVGVNNTATGKPIVITNTATAPNVIIHKKSQDYYMTRERLDLLREADDVVNKVMRQHNLMGSVAQMPVVLVPVAFTSDGIKTHNSTTLSPSAEGESIVLRPVSTSDFMTCKFAGLPISFLEDVCIKLLAIKGITAVLYDVTHKPPGTVEWE